ncbi:MAG: hypothetical protein H7320_13740 [Ferruginibacter sp.]|nr:hypothetical protein [Ferruginibacter sp.]
MICQPSRLIIYPGDVRALLECSASKASRKLKELREATGKKDHHEISIKEYCEYFDIEYADVCKFLKLIPAA